jgi:YD repeat-containing protein
MLQNRLFTVVLPDGKQQTVRYDGTKQAVRL